MAQVFGEPGRNATEESYKRFRRIALAAMLVMAALGAIAGYSWGSAFPFKNMHWIWALCINATLLLLMFLIARWGKERFDCFDRERMSWRKGAVGEVLVSGILADLPGGYFVINDVTKRLGNIDHVVIGLTGVYVIDTKNWKGTVKSNGNGELLVNEKALVKPPIKRMLGAVMDFQSKLKVLTEQEYFVQGVMAFTSAYVDAKFGDTGYIHCVRDEQLNEYLTNPKFSKRLTKEEIDRAKRATLQMAGMDERF